jgi:hypothetical protein
MRRTLLIFSTAISLSLGVSAQLALTPSLVASGGNTYEGENLMISWSVGELAVTTLKGTSLQMTQGFQQPLGIGTGIKTDEFEESILVYPNPLKNELFVKFNIERPGNYILEIMDVTGRIISQVQLKPINSGEIIQLNTSTYNPGIYLLKIQTTDGQGALVKSIRKVSN